MINCNFWRSNALLTLLNGRSQFICVQEMMHFLTYMTENDNKTHLNNGTCQEIKFNELLYDFFIQSTT